MLYGFERNTVILTGIQAFLTVLRRLYMTLNETHEKEACCDYSVNM